MEQKCPGCRNVTILSFVEAENNRYQLVINDTVTKAEIIGKNKDEIQMFESVLGTPMCKDCRVRKGWRLKRDFDIFIRSENVYYKPSTGLLLEKNCFGVFEKIEYAKVFATIMTHQCAIVLDDESFHAFELNIGINYTNVLSYAFMNYLESYATFPIRTEHIAFPSVKLYLRNMILKEIIESNTTNKDTRLLEQFKILKNTFPSDVSAIILLFV